MKIDRLEVRDATEPMEILVTPGDIRRGQKKTPKGCAVAVACRRQLQATEVRVHLSRIYVKTKENEWLRYATPQSMRSEIIAFDRGGEFNPGKYELGKVHTKTHRKGPVKQTHGHGMSLHKLNPPKPSIQLGRTQVGGPYATSVPQRAPVRKTHHAIAGVRPWAQATTK